MPNLDEMSIEDKLALVELLKEKKQRTKYNFINTVFPDEGPLSRDKYQKHLTFFEAGRNYKERAFIAGNRSGKTFAAAYETTLHLTGRYPSWWTGKRFDHPISSWVSSVSNNSTRDIVQEELLGGVTTELGTRMIPLDCIADIKIKPGVPGAVETAKIRHVSGGLSVVSFKSYDQKQKAFQGTAKDWIWLDEEPTYPTIYSECLTRTMTTNGHLICTFTPLLGLSDTVMRFLPDGRVPVGGVVDNKFVIMASWEDAPHLSEEDKQRLFQSYLPHERDARMKGIPALGSGAIYPIPEDEILVEPFELPESWPRAFGMDVGWNKTAAVWGAYDPASDVWYIYSEYYRSQAEPPIHADAIKSRGSWICGVVDPASAGSNQKDGTKLYEIYCNLGLNLAMADNSVEAGLQECWQRLSGGRIRVFTSLRNWISEFRIYRRDDKGKIVKKNDHLMDAMRYLVMSGFRVAETRPDDDDIYEEEYKVAKGSQVTGY